MKPGRASRADYEYIRQGTANIFCIVEPLSGRRLTYASKNRTARAFTRAIERIARRYSSAEVIHLVMDNLNTHAKKSIVDTLGSAAGERLWKRFRVHHTPKHGSWLNAAEMEASMVSRECLGGRRLGHLHTLKAHISAWRRAADRARRPIRWKFTVKDARRLFRYDGIITRRSKD